MERQTPKPKPKEKDDVVGGTNGGENLSESERGQSAESEVIAEHDKDFERHSE